MAPQKRARRTSTPKAKPKLRGDKRDSANLLLRDLDPDVAQVLRARAKRSGRSLQQELHAALRRDANRNFDEAAALSAAWHDRLRGRALPDTTALLREDRSR